MILLEEQWSENVHTAEGLVMHQRVHGGDDEVRRDVWACRGVRVRSLRLGLAGTMDCLELRLLDAEEPGGILVVGTQGRWLPIPVEYKHGTTRDEIEYEVQLCAQALCLEEMLCTEINEGYLYYGESRRRLKVVFTSELRQRVEEGASQLHAMLRSGVTPLPQFSAKCHKCSMVDLCLPRLPTSEASKYLAGIMDEIAGGIS